ncbi:MAG TPA: tail fiber protein, partial [Woeseiaceae bacterium]|nr:tail fiber protein [Woeseiaceae bacterium]
RVYGRVLDLNEIREASRNVPIAAANVSTGGEAWTGNGRPTFETGPDFSFPSPTGSAPNIPDATAIDDSLQPTSPLQQYATQSLACRIDTDTTIRNRPADIDYRADCVVDVTAALTIEPGVVIQFAEDAGLGVYDSGSLTANGTTTEPVIFRGVQAAPGYWRGIHFETNSSDNRLSHVEIRHAASSYVYCCNAPAALQIKGGQMTLENSTISASGACDIVVGPNADFQQSDNSFSSNQDNDGCYSPVVDVVAKGSCLTGSVEVFAGNYAPRGWAYANGDTLDTQAYSALFSIVGTTYGGDGQAGFALPNIPVPSSSVSAQFAMICVNGVYPSRS